MAVTANDLILGALKRINAYAPGESLASDDAEDARDTLNELLDSWSTDGASIFSTLETLLTFVAGQYQYTVGNYDGGTFPGIVTNLSATITGATVPADMIARSDITGAGIPAGTTVLSTNPGAGTIVMSAPATASPGIQQITYTVPGDFKMSRPLRVHKSFTRITTGNSGLDYPIDVLDRQAYTDIGFKGISAPWPIGMWYNPTMPLGNLYFYQNPSGAGQLHLFSDIILTRFDSLTQNIVMPQGYVRMIKWNLARELAPEYGKQWSALMERNAKDSWDAVKALNAVPVPVANYDGAICGQRTIDAGWILSGGFR